MSEETTETRMARVEERLAANSRAIEDNGQTGKELFAWARDFERETAAARSMLLEELRAMELRMGERFDGFDERLSEGETELTKMKVRGATALTIFGALFTTIGAFFSSAIGNAVKWLMSHNG